MFMKIRAYKQQNVHEFNNEEVFSIVKAQILDTNLVPDILPWNYPGNRILN
jgi:hypothetical protein